MAQVIIDPSGPLALLENRGGKVHVISGENVAAAKAAVREAERQVDLAEAQVEASARNAAIAQAWSEGSAPGGGGTKSARGWAADAQASAGKAAADVAAELATDLAAAELARDQAADLVLPENRFVSSDLAIARAAGEAGTSIGTYFMAVGEAEGEAEVRRRTAGGSALLYTEITKAALANPAKGAAMIAYGIGTAKSALDRQPRGAGKLVKHLNIPTWDGNPSTTHPGVIYIPEGFGGYSYWMVHTPFPDDFREQPEIVVSNDGYNWHRPEGVQVPLYTYAQFKAALGPTFIYNSDPCILRLHDGRLAVYSRPVSGTFSGPFGAWLVRWTTDDGVNWSPMEVCHTIPVGDPITYTSPAIVAEPDGTYTMFAMGRWDSPPAFAPTGNILRRTSPDGVTWSEPELCTVPGNLRVWHLDVQRTIDGVYHMLVNPGNSTLLMYYWISTDGITWLPGCGQAGTQAIPVIPGVDGTGRYRCAFQPVAGEAGRFHIWLATFDNRTTPASYRIGAFLPSFPLAGQKNLNVTDDAIRHHGVRALGLDKADNRSLFFGLNAALNNTGTQVTAVGEQAGSGNSGTLSVFVGSRTGLGNTGNQVCAFGRNAGVNNAGINLVAIGFDAGSGNTGGSAVAVGIGSGLNNSGIRNVALGDRAGQNVTANNATSLGALSKADHLNSVALGYNTATSQADQVAVGNRDLEIQGNGKGVYLRSPDGTRYRLTVANGGAVTVAPG